MLLQIGPLRLAIMDGSAKQRTLYLPPTDQKGLELEWVEKSHTWEMDTGGERTRVLGYLPVLVCKWTAYDCTPRPYPLGVGDGQSPCLEDLLIILSSPTGKLKMSPGLAAGGFIVDRCQTKPIGRKGPIYTGLQVTFRARNTRPVRDLDVF